MSTNASLLHVATLTQELEKFASSLGTEELFHAENDSARTEALEAVKKLNDVLCSPKQVAMELMLNMRQTPFQAMSVRIALDLNIFSILSESGSESISISELVERTKAEEGLLVRILRVLTASGFAHELDVGVYSASAFSTALMHSGMEASFRLAFDHATLISNITPEFFGENGYKNPQNPENTPFKFATKTDLEYFPWLETMPEVLNDFALWMSWKEVSSRGWIDWFPVQAQILDGSEEAQADTSGSVLLVDVGGGKGHDLKIFKKRFGDAHGQLILEDLPAMVPDVSLKEGFEIVEHDFFTPQPIKGARVYYLHTVLHDWPDERCREILLNIKQSMRPGYSKIIINEAILPDKGASLGHSARDLGMMCMLGACQRSEKSWRELITSVGLVVSKVWYDPVPGDGVIEAELPIANKSSEQGPLSLH